MTPAVDAAIGHDGYRTLGDFLSKMLASAKHRATVDAGAVGAVVYAGTRLEVMRAAAAIATVVGLRTSVSLDEVGRDDDGDEGLRFFVTVRFSWGALS